MRRKTKRQLRFLAGFAAYFAVLWLLWDSRVLYPLKLFVVLLHEASHAAAAVATGGRIERIVVTAAQGGACYCPGGNRLITLSAGYLGSVAWGGLLLELARAPGRWSRGAVAGVGLAVLAFTGTYVRNAFGFAFGLLFGGGLLAAARWLPPAARSAILAWLGLTSCLYALLDIKSDILDRPELRSDARMLAEATGIPTLLWGTVWIAVALAAGAWLFRRRWKEA